MMEELKESYLSMVRETIRVTMEIIEERVGKETRFKFEDILVECAIYGFNQGALFGALKGKKEMTDLLEAKIKEKGLAWPL